MFKSLKLYWNFLIGVHEEFSLEQKTFHGICLITSALLLFTGPLNFAIGLDIFGYIIFGVFFMLCSLFYISRFLRFFSISKYIYAIFLYLTLIFSYFLNVGIAGTTFLVFIFTFHLLISIMPQKSLWIWVPFHLIFGYALLTFEYFYPEKIISSYLEKSFQFVDIGFSFTLSVLSIYLTTLYLRNNYIKEQQLAQNRLKELDKSNLELKNQQEALELANATKDKFVSIIGHDLINPFNITMGFANLLASNYDDYSDEERKRFITEINKSATSSYNLTKNLLDWAKSQKNKIVISKEKQVLYHLIQQSIASYMFFAKNKNITVDLDIAKDLLVEVDNYTMSTVFTNLFSNAIKFTPENGRIQISASNTMENVEILFSDNGIGLDQDKAHNLFSDLDEKDAGLGLLLCKEFTEMNGGDIFVRINSNKNEDNKGTTIVVKLPK